MQPDFSSTVVGVSSASMGAVTVGLALRLGTRIPVDRRLAWEDGLALISWLITMSSVTYTFASVTAKASLAALYLTLFRGRSCLLRTLNQGLLLFLVCEAIEEVAVVMSQCLPAIGAWSSSGSGTCVNLKPFWWTTFACYMATNILLFFQPIPFLWYKGLPPYELATLVGIAIAGILRLCDALHLVRDRRLRRPALLLRTVGQRSPPLVEKGKGSAAPAAPAAIVGIVGPEMAVVPGPPLPAAGTNRGGHHRPREAAAATTSNAFQERIAWLELLNSHSPYVVPGSHRPLGTQIMIESFPSAKAATSAVETPTPTTAHTNWCRHSRIDEVEECGKGKKQSMGGGIMVTREVVCTVEETIISGKHGEEEGEGHDQDMSSSSGPGSVIFTTTNEHIG
ncbi:hypothetical protein PG988_000405 [Apiospora saccharicola]